LWQVKSGTIFDNILVTDDETLAEKVGAETWGATKDAEKKAKEALDEVQREKEKAEREAKKDEEKPEEEEETPAADDDDEDKAEKDEL